MRNTISVAARTGLSVVTVFGLAVLVVYSSGCGKQNPDNELGRSAVQVNHEWGALKEVFIGIGQGIVVPDYMEGFHVLEPEYVEIVKKYGGMALADVDPDSQDRIIEQVDRLAGALEERGIKVHRARLLRPEEDRYLESIQRGRSLVFSRDPLVVIGDNVIEASLRFPCRRKERYSLRPVLDMALKGKAANLVSVPPASPHPDDTGPFLEGGDVMLDGYDIYVGLTGNGSNEAGFRWLQDYLGPDYRVHLVPLGNEFLHLDCVLSLVRPGLGIIYRDAFTEGLPGPLKDWEFIEITGEEARKLGANVLVIDERTVIVDAQHRRIADELRRRDIEVLEVPYQEVATMGGGFRCTHHPLIRESTLE